MIFVYGFAGGSGHNALQEYRRRFNKGLVTGMRSKQRIISSEKLVEVITVMPQNVIGISALSRRWVALHPDLPCKQSLPLPHHGTPGLLPTDNEKTSSDWNYSRKILAYSLLESTKPTAISIS